jgi:hypothetical protein
VVSNGVVSVPLEGALVAGVRAVFHFVSVTSVSISTAAAAAPVASVVVVVGGPSVTTVTLLKSRSNYSSDLEIGENRTRD